MTLRKALVLAEGPSEERFVKAVLNPHFATVGLFLQPVIVATKRVNAGGKFKGGIPSYEKVKREILNLLGDSSAVTVTTMLDFYGLPESFPGRTNPQGTKPQEKILYVEQAIRDDIQNQRFLPYLSLHEFEAVLFVDPQEIANGFSRPELLKQLQDIRRAFPTPEEINDNPQTAPSARLQQLFPRYSKPFFGSLIATRIGLNAIRAQCAHFNAWVTALERV